MSTAEDKKENDMRLNSVRLSLLPSQRGGCYKEQGGGLQKPPPGGKPRNQPVSLDAHDRAALPAQTAEPQPFRTHIAEILDAGCLKLPFVLYINTCFNMCG